MIKAKRGGLGFGLRGPKVRGLLHPFPYLVSRIFILPFAPCFFCSGGENWTKKGGRGERKGHFPSTLFLITRCLLATGYFF